VDKAFLSLGTASANAFLSHLMQNSIAFVPFVEYYRIQEPSRKGLAKYGRQTPQGARKKWNRRKKDKPTGGRPLPFSRKIA